MPLCQTAGARIVWPERHRRCDDAWTDLDELGWAHQGLDTV